jgi:hypothetical protein
MISELSRNQSNFFEQSFYHENTFFIAGDDRGDRPDYERFLT